jgi:hypothetical protein
MEAGVAKLIQRRFELVPCFFERHGQRPSWSASSFPFVTRMARRIGDAVTRALLLGKLGQQLLDAPVSVALLTVFLAGSRNGSD